MITLEILVHQTKFNQAIDDLNILKLTANN